MAYAELSSRFPGTGALYSYVHQCWGSFYFISVSGNVAAVSLGAQTFSSYIEAMIFNDSINRLNSTEYFRDVLFSNIIDIPASLVIIVSTMIIMSGTAIVAKLSTLTSVVSVTSLIILTVTGFRNGDVRNLKDAEHDSLIPFGFTGIIHGAAICYFAYTGFVTVCFSSEEAKNPKRSVPIAIGIVVVFVIFLYQTS
ncbi:cationic amino acid transporter 4-like [Patella vulgata]|uniref:cationic amino acid transporter 4-like n=1 Tax=Patella vulgata TaxID=6465 RepID=UPI0024A8B835|nr:cationic amino acid transporter 4-like [Patella vulgata]